MNTPANGFGSLIPSAERDPIQVTRLPIKFEGDDARVILLPFMATYAPRVRSLFERIAKLDERTVEVAIKLVSEHYQSRHDRIDKEFSRHYAAAVAITGDPDHWSDARKRLAGAFLTMEYSIEAAALFNPSIVPHPDQSAMKRGYVRFLMSLRATGEGHVSSIVFRTGVITADNSVVMDPTPRVVSRAKVSPDRSYHKPLFQRKLGEMGVHGPTAEAVINPLPERFSLIQLHQSLETVRAEHGHKPTTAPAIENITFLARSNYHIDMPEEEPLSELVIYPMSEDESRGMEDLRLVRFTHDDGQVEYFGTYTAYNGYRILPMMLQTSDFRRIEVHSLNGACAINKGMALFPRKIGGHYVMCSRIDGENLFISYSDYPHFWESAKMLKSPRSPWELMQVGNCGSPIETDEGWLLLTHGVGPMRTYCIGAMLLDRDDPLKVKGSLSQPLITPVEEEREGYVPNVVYTCGAMAHGENLFIPYALSDTSTTVAVVKLPDLINRLLDSKP
ncbi:MAG: glycosidase [Phycisphaera sp.]|nr:glycosidase [Phycisphaera sp.]